MAHCEMPDRVIAYVGSKASWEVIAEGVPQYQEAVPEIL